MKAYYNQQKVSSSFQKFFNIFSLPKPIIKVLSFIIIGMISSESVVTSDVARKLKDDFSSVNLESIERRFRRFFSSFSSIAYSFYSSFITHIISRFSVKHSDNKIHISFDHMFCKDKFTILLFSLRIGKQGIPLWFRCFKAKHNSDAYSFELIKHGISFCANLFADKNYHIIFLADRCFPHIDILSHIQDIGCFYCIRSKSFFTYSFYDSNSKLVTKHLRDIKPNKYSPKVLSNVFYTRKLFKTNIVVSNYSNSDEPWYLITNDDTSRAIKNYSYRFGSIESIFKNQKSNGFRLESTNTQKFNTLFLFLLLCALLLFGLLLLALILLKTNTNIISIFVMSKNAKMLLLLAYIHFSISD